MSLGETFVATAGSGRSCDRRMDTERGPGTGRRCDVSPVVRRTLPNGVRVDLCAFHQCELDRMTSTAPRPAPMIITPRTGVGSQVGTDAAYTAILAVIAANPQGLTTKEVNARSGYHSNDRLLRLAAAGRILKGVGEYPARFYPKEPTMSPTSKPPASDADTTDEPGDTATSPGSPYPAISIGEPRGIQYDPECDPPWRTVDLGDAPAEPRGASPVSTPSPSMSPGNFHSVEVWVSQYAERWEASATPPAIVERDGRDDEVGDAGRPLTVWERDGVEVGRVEPWLRDPGYWWRLAGSRSGTVEHTRDEALRAVRQALGLPLADPAATPDATAPYDYDRALHRTTDAMRWATEMDRIVRDAGGWATMNVEWLHVWMCNAIMAGMDEGRRRASPPVPAPEPERPADDVDTLRRAREHLGALVREQGAALARAYADVERMTRERDEARAEVDAAWAALGDAPGGTLAGAIESREWPYNAMRRARDGLVTTVERQGAALATAHADVERLTRERDEASERHTTRDVTLERLCAVLGTSVLGAECAAAATMSEVQRLRGEVAGLERAHAELARALAGVTRG